MFDTTHHHRHITNNSSPSKMEVKEYKAPTDESIKYVEEVHKKVIDSIISDTPVETNNVKAHTIIVPPMIDRFYTIISKLNINGADYFTESKVHVSDLDEFNGIRSVNLDAVRDRSIIWELLITNVIEQYTLMTGDYSKIKEFKR